MSVRAAVIGCGRIGGGYNGAMTQTASHASGYVRDPRVELVAACDSDEQARTRFAQQWGVARMFSDYEALFAGTALDIVSVCTWDDQHVGAVRAAVAAGIKAIVCEKPLAPTAAEASDLVQLCRESGVQLAVGYQRRWEPAHCAVRDFVAEGGLGEVLAVNGYYVGGLRHNGCAWINLARFLVSEINTAIVVSGANRKSEDVALALQFGNGASGSLQAANREDYSIFEIDILGTCGRARFSDAGERLEVWQVEADPRYPGFKRLTPSLRKWPEPSVGDALNKGLAGIVDLLLGSGENVSSGADAARDMEIVEAALARGRTGATEEMAGGVYGR